MLHVIFMFFYAIGLKAFHQWITQTQSSLKIFKFNSIFNCLFLEFKWKKIKTNTYSFALLMKDCWRLMKKFEISNILKQKWFNHRWMCISSDLYYFYYTETSYTHATVRHLVYFVCKQVTHDTRVSNSACYYQPEPCALDMCQLVCFWNKTT